MKILGGQWLMVSYCANDEYSQIPHSFTHPGWLRNNGYIRSIAGNSFQTATISFKPEVRTHKNKCERRSR